MPRGGYRAPSGGPRVAGPGKASQRSDTNQPVNVGRVGDSEDLTHGDRQKLEAALRQSPIGRQQQPQVARRPASPALGPSGTQRIPKELFEMPSVRPNEDPRTPTANIPDPDDDKEFVLQMLASAPWGNVKVRQMLQDLRTERGQGPALTPIAQGVPAPGPAPEPPAVEEPEAVPLGAEEPLPEEPVDEDFI